MAEQHDPAGDGEARTPDQISPSQRRIFGTRRIAAPAPAESRPELEEKLNNLVDSVKVLQSHITGEKPVPAPENDLRKKGTRRFQRVAGEDTPESEGEAVIEPEIRGDEATLNKNIAWPRLARSEEFQMTKGVRGAAYLRRHPFILWVFAQVVGLGLLLFGYWAGQSLSGDDEGGEKREKPAFSSSGGHDLLARVGVSDRVLEAADLGLVDEKKGDVDAARGVWDEAVAGRLHLPGAEYRLALLDIQRGDFSAADIHLSNSLAAGEMMASCYFVDACFARQRSDYSKVAKQFAQATHVEPFDAKYFFCLGEALRRSGKTQAGIDAIKKALNRPVSLADADLMDFKMRLARIEAAHDEEFNTELGQRLAKAPVSGDWLLLAAARDLLHAAYPAAAAHLNDAARVLPRRTYEALVQDYVFQGYAGHPEIGPLIKNSLPSLSATPSDPSGWPLEEADPAAWTPFAPAL